MPVLDAAKLHRTAYREPGLFERGQMVVLAGSLVNQGDGLPGWGLEKLRQFNPKAIGGVPISSGRGANAWIHGQVRLPATVGELPSPKLDGGAIMNLCIAHFSGMH